MPEKVTSLEHLLHLGDQDDGGLSEPSSRPSVPPPCPSSSWSVPPLKVSQYARRNDDGRQVFDATVQIEVGQKYPEILGLTI